MGIKKPSTNHFLAGKRNENRNWAQTAIRKYFHVSALVSGVRFSRNFQLFGDSFPHTNRSVAARFERGTGHRDNDTSQVPLAIERLIRVKQVENRKFQSQLWFCFFHIFLCAHTIGRRSRKTKGDQKEEEAAKCFSKHSLRLPLSFFSPALSWLQFPITNLTISSCFRLPPFLASYLAN